LTGLFVLKAIGIAKRRAKSALTPEGKLHCKKERSHFMPF